MSERKGFTALLTDRKISIKVGLGFACVLAILAVVSGVVWAAFGSAAEGFTAYSSRVATVDLARDLDRGFVELRRNAREYAITSAEVNVTQVRKEAEHLNSLLALGRTQIRSPERHARVENMVKLTQAYLGTFERVVTLVRDISKLNATDLPTAGSALGQTLGALIADARQTDRADVEQRANEADRQILMGRVGAARILGHFGSDQVTVVSASLEKAAGTLRGIDEIATGTPLAAKSQSVLSDLAAYRRAVERTIGLDLEVRGLVDGEMRANGDQMQRDAEALKESGIVLGSAQEKETMASFEATRWQVLELSIGGVLIGAICAWLIGRGIARPVTALCAAMGALAGGDNSVLVTGVERGDEIGAMAKAVDVFKRNAIEVERLREAQENQKREAQAERQTALRRLADGFESQVGGVIQSVSAATTQLQSASKHMEDNAARTSTEATSVATASAQAAANAQAVASASEQLTASISEIAKQVESAQSVASRADQEAGETTELVRRLSETVNAIGAIVALINDVASQTNLLALNATIEAARAGDAGKGFAVVASEVKNLANQTAKATEEIAGKIGAVQSGTEEAAKAIASITKVMSEMSSISTAIAAAVEQQSSATAEIARNVEQAAAGTQEVSARIAKVDVAARETGTTAGEINGSANDLSEQARTLRAEVSRFLEQVRSDQKSVRVLAWDNAWNVGIPAIDRHHREFLNSVNELFAALMNGEGSGKAPAIADTIARSIEPHFAEEEDEMRRHRYPDLAAHQQAHRAFATRFQEFSRSLQRGDAIDAGALFDFVDGWWRQHMIEHDGPLAKFLNIRKAA